MRRAVILSLACLVAGCSPGSALPPAGSQLLSNNAASLISSNGAALATREAVSGLGSAMTALRDMKGAASAQPRGSSMSTMALRVLDAAHEESVTYSQIQWFYTESSSTATNTATESILNFSGTEEGRLADGKAVEKYAFSMEYRALIPESNESTVDEWSFSRDETVSASIFRKLGRYLSRGSASRKNGRHLVTSTQEFTPAGGGTATTSQLSSSYSEADGFSYRVSGALPGGGSVDLTSTSTHSVPADSSGAPPEFPTSGSASFTQKGNLVTAKGETFAVDTAVTVTFGQGADGPTSTTKGSLGVKLQDKLNLRFDFNDAAIAGTIQAADGSKLGDITVDAQTMAGKATFNDGTTETIALAPLFELLMTAQDTRF